MKRIFRQVIFDMRHSPLIASVTIVGTAMAVFLVLISLTIERATWVDFAPESNRSRSLSAKFMHIESASNKMQMSSRMSVAAINRLFGNLESAEAVAIYSDNNPGEASAQGQAIHSADIKPTNGDFWKVYNFTFVSGAPYTDADAAAEPKAVINSDMARLIFGTTDVVGRSVNVNHTLYRITGVVEPVTTLADVAYAQIWTSIDRDDLSPVISSPEKLLGDYSVTILAPSASATKAVKSETAARYEELANQLMTSDSTTLHSHLQPVSIADGKVLQASNQDPYDRASNWILYAILLLVPAINMIGASQGRLRHRISEIGLKRAMGATKLTVTLELLTESFIATLCGGLIGTVLAVVFAYFFADAVFAKTNWFATETLSSVNAPMSLLIGWGTVGCVVAICFVLNLLSAGIPAWLASRITPADALGGNRR